MSFLIQVLLGFLCLEPVLLFTASQPSDSNFAKERSVGQRLVHQLMESHTKHLHSSLTTSRPDKLTASTLRLLTAMVMQGPSTAREVAAWFNFAYKPVDLLANRTDKIQVRTKELERYIILVHCPREEMVEQ